MSHPLEHLLERSGALHSAISNSLAEGKIAHHPRAVIAATHADIALEHGGSIILLMSTGHLSSALALLRVQLDAVVRAVWILYAASEAKVEVMATAVKSGRLEDPNNIPGIAEMIDQIVKQGPSGVGQSLAVLKVAAWRPLSSFIHSGVFALHERHGQLPETWSTDSLRNANGLSLMAAMTIAATMHGIPPGVMREIQLGYMDCCPPTNADA